MPTLEKTYLTPCDTWELRYGPEDHLGSTRMVIDGETASFTAREQTFYYSYGNMHEFGVAPVNTREKFTGKEFDQEGGDGTTGTGIEAFHFGARMYDPEVGVWWACDPQKQFWSGYSYAGNGHNPITAIDPDGESLKDVLYGGLIGVATNIIPGQTNLRDEYTPDDPRDYNNTLSATDVAAGLLGAFGNDVGNGMMVIGSSVVVVSGVVTVGSGGTLVIAGAPGAVVGSGTAVTGLGVKTLGSMMMSNSAANQSARYERGKIGAPEVTRKIPNDKLKFKPKNKGNAPIGEDNKPVELNHTDQKAGNASPREEMTRTDHRGKGNYKKKPYEYRTKTFYG
jgi:RHS repeat-associated protein